MNYAKQKTRKLNKKLTRIITVTVCKKCIERKLRTQNESIERSWLKYLMAWKSFHSIFTRKPYLKEKNLPLICGDMMKAYLNY